MIKKISGLNNLEKEINKGVVLVEFYSDQCAPCRVQLPILQKINKECKNLKVIKVNATDEFKIIQKYGIQSLPTMIIFKEGKNKKVLVGLHDKDSLIEVIKKYEK